MTFDPKYGYARIGNNSFTLGGQAAPAPRDSDGGDENAAARRTRDRDYLFSRFGWFWDRRAEIFNTPEIYGIYPLFSGLSLAYVGGGPLSLGMLFYLWRTSQWLAECPECGSTALIYFAGGSPLSGMNRWAAHCIFCGANVAGSAEKFQTDRVSQGRHLVQNPARRSNDAVGAFLLNRRQPAKELVGDILAETFAAVDAAGCDKIASA